MANPNCPTCGGTGQKSKVEKGTKPNGEEYEWWRQVPCGC